MFQERIIFPEPVENTLDLLVNHLKGLDFFNDPNIPEGYEGNCEVHLRNYAGEQLLLCFIEGEELLFDEKEFESILQKAIIGCCLDSLLDNNLIDTIQDENGENIFWSKKNN
jgi:hypothetical protein